MNNLKCKVVDKKDKRVEIEIEGQKVLVSLDCLPSSADIGKTFKIYFLDPEETEITEKKLAKTILEEILNGK